MTYIFKSQPAKGAVVRDWTKHTLTLDIENSLGETFHFEIKPGEAGNLLPSSTSDATRDKHGAGKIVEMLIPLPSPEPEQ